MISSGPVAETTLLPAERIRHIAHAALLGAGLPDAHATIQVDVLLEAELRGRPSHGLMRLPRLVARIHNGVVVPGASGTHAWRGNFLSVDGGRGLGPVVAATALDALHARIRDAGVAVAAIANSNHVGMMAWYAERCARRGAILIALTTSEALVHPWGGRSAMLGTNPIAIGIPTAGAPFVLDMATSLVSMGQIHNHATRDLPLQEGWARDAKGDPTLDAQAAKTGSIAPFGGAKGYALGLAFEVMVTALTAAAIGPEVTGTLDETQPCNKGDVFILIDYQAAPAVAARICAYLQAVRESGGDQDVLIPNERALKTRAERLEVGVPVEGALWRNLCRLAGEEESA